MPRQNILQNPEYTEFLHVLLKEDKTPAQIVNSLKSDKYRTTRGDVKLNLLLSKFKWIDLDNPNAKVPLICRTQKRHPKKTNTKWGLHIPGIVWAIINHIDRTVQGKQYEPSAHSDIVHSKLLQDMVYSYLKKSISKNDDLPSLNRLFHDFIIGFTLASQSQSDEVLDMMRRGVIGKKIKKKYKKKSKEDYSALHNMKLNCFIYYSTILSTNLTHNAAKSYKNMTENS